LPLKSELTRFLVYINRGKLFSPELRLLISNLQVSGHLDFSYHFKVLRGSEKGDKSKGRYFKRGVFSMNIILNQALKLKIKDVQKIKF